jgi:BirA family transcriptional regulator, biotin operon repressor / biotin---[acetyl-CoA-carboxylase] ligase
VSAGCRLPEGFLLHAHERLGSTNDEARRLADEGAPAGTVVLAAEQGRGRGRHGRSWASPPGNLYASVLLRPECAMAVATQLSLVAGLALAEALAALGPPAVDLQLKWPNDVLISGAKTAGILLEGASSADGQATWVVAGAGVNLVSCPDDLGYPVTCLAREGFPTLSPEAVLEAYLQQLDDWLRRWRETGFGAIRRAWLARGFGLGSEIRLRLDRGELRGRWLDLTDTGSLLVEQAGGRRREIATGDVFYLDR